ncbi:MAG: helicase C-terminal domain-containing protein, partial [Myxococcota bacterium]
AAERARLCPSELGLDLTHHVDLVIGDYNYVFDPSMALRRHFGEDDARGWIVVVDEVHQLMDRVREALSPGIDAALAREATARLWAAGSEFAPYVALALVVGAARSVPGHAEDGLAQVELPVAALRALGEEIDAIGLDYALLTADRPIAPTGDDPWLKLAWQVLRLAAAVDETDVVRVSTVRRAAGDERLGFTCLDPSGWLGPRLGWLGGFVGLSATLGPPEFHRDLLGLDPEKLDVVVVPSPFPPERRKVLIASRVSTAYRDRAEQAEPTAKLLSAAVAEVPGNVAIYFSSFAMLDDLVPRLTLGDRVVVVQRPGMDDALRAAALGRLSEGRPTVLCAVLGGVFAEGIDLPPGALSAVVVVGPALPPIGLERELLKAHYESRFGEGFRYASLVPGTTRVVQAAGRLVRRAEDRGVIVLVDRRFRWRDVRALLPPEWAPEVALDPAAAIRAFFAAEP